MKNKQFINGLVVGLVVVALIAAGISVVALKSQQRTAPNSKLNQSDTTTGSSDPANEAAPTPSERVSITFTDDGFEPENITVEIGTIVTVVNKSSRQVQFSSDDHPAHRDNTEMNLKVLSPGESESYTATVAGTWGFHDHLNDSKTGTVNVRNN